MAFRKTVLRPREPQQAQAQPRPAPAAPKPKVVGREGRFTFLMETSQTVPEENAVVFATELAALSGHRCNRKKVRAEKIEADEGTLLRALDDTERDRWRGMRSATAHVGQSKIAIAALEAAAKILGRRPTAGPLRVDEVTPEMLRYVRAKWLGMGTSPSAVNKRMNCLSAMGVSVLGCRAKQRRQLKWWLTPDHLEALRRHYGPSNFLDYLDWTIQVGPRVEETLRLTRGHFAASFTTVTIPGTKTGSAQRALRLSSDAQAIAKRRFPEGCDGNHPMFPFDYLELLAIWAEAMEVLGVDNPLATPKAVRRSAARTLSLKGMPIDMIRQYLGHANIQTTMGYLTLTGGYNEDEFAKFLG